MEVRIGLCGFCPILELEKYQMAALEDSTKLVRPLRKNIIHMPVKAMNPSMTCWTIVISTTA